MWTNLKDWRPNADEELARGIGLEEAGDLDGAAAAYDLAFGANPESEEISRRRSDLLDRLAVTEYDIVFRYIPQGPFMMGSMTGDVDEQPVHRVDVDRFWVAETPVNWKKYCELLNWRDPPEEPPRWPKAGRPPGWDSQIRSMYCENETLRATDWHAHHPNAEWFKASGEVVSASEFLFGSVPRADQSAPWAYDEKPLVSITWQDASDFCEVMTSFRRTYRLPTEAEWEKAARGGLIGQPYPWGSEPPDGARCDFDNFNQFAVQKSKRFPPNGYGLYATSGGVWEWTSDWYDAQFYRGRRSEANPRGPRLGKEKVLRGGSWADCAECATVSFRMAKSIDQRSLPTPNVGFRLCRVENPKYAEHRRQNKR